MKLSTIFARILEVKIQSKYPQLVAIIDRSWLLCHFQLRQNAHGEKNISIFGQPPIGDFSSECRIVNYLCKRLDGKISTWLTVSSKAVDNLCTYISREHIMREHVDRSQSVFYFLPQERHSQAGSTRSPVVQNLYFSIMDINMYFRIEDSSLIFVEAWLCFEPHAWCWRLLPFCSTLNIVTTSITSVQK